MGIDEQLTTGCYRLRPIALPRSSTTSAARFASRSAAKESTVRASYGHVCESVAARLGVMSVRIPGLVKCTYEGEFNTSEARAHVLGFPFRF